MFNRAHRWLFVASVCVLVLGVCLASFADQPGVVADADAAGDSEEKDLISVLQQKSISLGNSFESFQNSGGDRDSDDPATFSLEHDAGSDTVFSTDFFLAWTPPQSFDKWNGEDWWETGSLSGALSVEGHIASNDDDSQDAWRFRATLHALQNLIDIPPEDVDTDTQSATPPREKRYAGPIDSILIDISAKHEANRDFDVEKIMGEVRIAPISRALGIGKELSLGKSGVGLLWDPWIGTDVGGTVDRSGLDNDDEDGTVLRAMAGVQLKIFFHSIEQAVGLKEVSFSVNERFFYLPLEDDDGTDHNFVELAFHFGITDNVFVDVKYKNGSDSPTFNEIETFSVGLGVRF